MQRRRVTGVVPLKGTLGCRFPSPSLHFLAAMRYIVSTTISTRTCHPKGPKATGPCDHGFKLRNHEPQQLFLPLKPSLRHFVRHSHSPINVQPGLGYAWSHEQWSIHLGQTAKGHRAPSTGRGSHATGEHASKEKRHMGGGLASSCPPRRATAIHSRHSRVSLDQY